MRLWNTSPVMAFSHLSIGQAQVRIEVYLNVVPLKVAEP